MVRNRFITPSAILAFALILSTIIFSGTWRKIKSENQIITVTGSAKAVPNYNFNAQGQNAGVRSYTSSQMIDISSSNVNLIKEMSLEISALVERGVSFQVNPPEFYYTKIGYLKKRKNGSLTDHS